MTEVVEVAKITQLARRKSVRGPIAQAFLASVERLEQQRAQAGTRDMKLQDLAREYKRNIDD